MFFFFFFPIRTDRRLEHLPLVNVGLIALNCLIYFLTGPAGRSAGLAAYRLDPLQPAVWQFITYQFLHASIMHLLGNMLFLYVFGNSVEDRLGKLGYLAFYLAGGVVAGLGHAMIEKAPVIGASGSICAVTGAFLALFPLSRVTVFYWIFFSVGNWEIASGVLILFQIAENLFSQFGRSGGVAYLAHLSGYSFGFLVGMGLLWTRLLPREPYDLLSMYNHYRRREDFRAMTRDGYRPWELDRNAEPLIGPETPLTPEMERIMALRAQITQAAAAHDLVRAAELYTQLLQLDSTQVLERQRQLDVANQLAAMGRYETAAAAYELFLAAYREDPHAPEVGLLLCALYARYLARPQRARELLDPLIPRLLQTEQQALAQQLLAELPPGL